MFSGHDSAIAVNPIINGSEPPGFEAAGCAVKVTGGFAGASGTGRVPLNMFGIEIGAAEGGKGLGAEVNEPRAATGAAGFGLFVGVIWRIGLAAAGIGIGSGSGAGAEAGAAAAAAKTTDSLAFSNGLTISEGTSTCR